MAEPITYTLTGYTDGAAVKAALDAGAASLPADQGTLQRYAETGTTLTVVDDGDTTYSVTVPLDGKAYSVTLTEDIDLLTSDAPTAPLIGSAVVYITQAATAVAVTTPAGWYWSNASAEAFDTDGAMYRLTLYSDPAGNIHADAELRGVQV